jgi:hypothetical protein
MGWSRLARKATQEGLESSGVDPEAAKWIGRVVGTVIMIKTFDVFSAAADSVEAIGDLAGEAGDYVPENPGYSANGQVTFGGGWDKPDPIANGGPKPEFW